MNQVEKPLTEEQIQEQARKAELQERILRRITGELQLGMKQVRAAVSLLEEGNTIPFIARYRKEMTGELDENELRSIEERLQYLTNLEDRKLEVIRLIDEQGKLTDELQKAIVQAVKLQEVEDLYRPYRQKRKTRASVAKEKGLEPLAVWILSQPGSGSLEQEAAEYVNAEKEVHTVEEAIQGALDIIAEQISDDAGIRAWVRQFTYQHGTICTEAKEAGAESVYEMYYDYREPVRKLPPHRILAMNRGEREDVLKIRLELDTARVHDHMSRKWLKGPSVTRDAIVSAV